MARDPAKTFFRDDRGAIAIITALIAVVLFGTVAVAIDLGRVLLVQSRMVAALDAAALAGARAMSVSGKTDEDISQVTQQVFSANASTSGIESQLADTPDVAIDRENEEVTISAEAAVAMTFGRVFLAFGMLQGDDNIDIARNATAAVPTKNVEVAFSLDITGSMMNPADGETESKFSVLKSTVVASVNTLFDVANRDDSVRIGVAPWAIGVKPDANLVSLLTGDGSDVCVAERGSWTVLDDTAPSPGDFVGQPASKCADATLMGLQDRTQRTQLVDHINGMGIEDFATSGHVGAAWGWYLLSPKWASFWPSGQAGAEYDDLTQKVVVFMSDGIFNYFNFQKGSAQTASSYQVFQQLCSNMKAAPNKILVFTIGFDLDNAPEQAKDELRDCASDPAYFFDASDNAELQIAFSQITNQVKSLRLK